MDRKNAFFNTFVYKCEKCIVQILIDMAKYKIIIRREKNMYQTTINNLTKQYTKASTTLIKNTYR